MSEQTILSELAAFTDAGQHTKFELLQNRQEYLKQRKVVYSLQLLVDSLYDMASNQLKSYCKDVVNYNSDVYKLLAYQYIVKIHNFYLDELKISQDMVDEYECYLYAGNWLDFIFNTQRSRNKLWDHRRY